MQQGYRLEQAQPGKQGPGVHRAACSREADSEQAGQSESRGSRRVRYMQQGCRQLCNSALPA